MIILAVENHAPYCPHPCEKANINEAKEEHTYLRGGGGCGGGCGGVCPSDFKNWIKSNDNKYGDRNDNGNGVQNRGNDLM